MSSQHTIKNKIILITGASSGIGAACAEMFAANGAKVLLAARRLEKLTQLKQALIKKYNTAVFVINLDVCNKKEITNEFKKLPIEWQQIDVLINNAGLALGFDKINDANPEDWDRMIDTNVKGLLYVTQAVLPNMLERNQGHIINIGSISGHDVYAGGSVYCATKFAVNAITQGLKKELLGTPIRVTSVDPGVVKTDFSETRFKGDIKRAEAVYQGFTPLTPADIADAVFYAATRPAHVNIQEIIILPTDQAGVDKIARTTTQ